MLDLSTTYLGLHLAHPIVPSASPLTSRIDRIKRLEDAGAPAVVLISLFEEQIEQESVILDHYLNYGTEAYAEALSYFPDLGTYNQALRNISSSFNARRRKPTSRSSLA